MTPPSWSRRRQRPATHCLVSRADPAFQVARDRKLRKRILTFASLGTLARCVQVSQEWFGDAVDVLYRSNPPFDQTSKNTARFPVYQNAVRIQTSLAVSDVKADGSLSSSPFSKSRLDPFKLTAVVDMFRVVWPKLSQMIFLIKKSATTEYKFGADQALVSYDTALGWRANTIYLDRTIIISPFDASVDWSLFTPPVVPTFAVEMSITIRLHPRKSEEDRPCGPSTSARHAISAVLQRAASTPSNVVFKHLVFGSLQVDINALLRILERPVKRYPLVDTRISLAVQAYVTPFTQHQFDLILRSPHARAMRDIQLDDWSVDSPLPKVIPLDLPAMAEAVSLHVPSLRSLAFAISLDGDFELTCRGLLDPKDPIGRLTSLRVLLHSPTHVATPFPFNLTRVLMRFLAVDGSLKLRWKNGAGQGKASEQDWSLLVRHIRKKPAAQIRALMSLDYQAMGVIDLRDLMNLQFLDGIFYDALSSAISMVNSWLIVLIRKLAPLCRTLPHEQRRKVMPIITRYGAYIGVLDSQSRTNYECGIESDPSQYGMLAKFIVDRTNFRQAVLTVLKQTCGLLNPPATTPALEAETPVNACLDELRNPGSIECESLIAHLLPSLSASTATLQSTSETTTPTTSEQVTPKGSPGSTDTCACHAVSPAACYDHVEKIGKAIDVSLYKKEVGLAVADHDSWADAMWYLHHVVARLQTAKGEKAVKTEVAETGLKYHFDVE